MLQIATVGVLPVPSSKFEHGHMKLQMDPLATRAGMAIEPASQQLAARLVLVGVHHVVSEHMGRALITRGKYFVSRCIDVDGCCMRVRASGCNGGRVGHGCVPEVGCRHDPGRTSFHPLPVRQLNVYFSSIILRNAQSAQNQCLRSFPGALE